MAKLKITITARGDESYNVIYDCGCIRDALNGRFINLMCKNEHDHPEPYMNKDQRLGGLECGCMNSWNKLAWCDEHNKFHKEAEIRNEICYNEKRIKHLKAQLQKMMLENIDHRNLINKIE